MGVKPKNYDFAGWVTRNDIPCTDGKIIRQGSFAHNDKKKVPLLWEHVKSTPEVVLGHAILEHRDEGVWGYVYLNDTDLASAVKEQVKHGDYDQFSIYANNVKLKNKTDVVHGNIVEVSLVLAGANSGATIEEINFSHGEYSDLEAIIYTGLIVEHSSKEKDSDMTKDKVEEPDIEEETEDDDPTIGEILQSMTDEQKAATVYLVEQAWQAAEEDADEEEDDESEADESNDKVKHSNKEGSDMTRNIFETDKTAATAGPTLTHSQLMTIVDDAKRTGSFKDSFLSHAAEYGIEDIDILFPDAKTLTSTPEFIKRQTEWVSEFLSQAKHQPFSRIKTVLADITHEEARARGYVKGNLKKEEVISLLKRITTPGTIYKKQKLDRDDIVDITDLDIVIWLKAEMRMLLEEELARAALLGDGRTADHPDKILDPAGSTNGMGVRSVLNDHDMYTHKITIQSVQDANDYVDYVTRARVHYRGSGKPNFYTTDSVITEMMMAKDRNKRRIYKTEQELCDAMRVAKLVPVEVMEQYPDVVGILLNPRDYTFGTTKGGEVSFFDDFDIDYNQYKYLYETRTSGALSIPKSAIALFRSSGQSVMPSQPSFNAATNTITIPSIDGVEYTIDEDVVTGTVTITDNTTVDARPKDGFFFPVNITTSWTFTYFEG